MSKEILSAVYLHDTCVSDGVMSPLLIVSTSWEDFIFQCAESFRLQRQTCALTTCTGICVNSFRVLEMLSSKTDIKLVLSGHQCAASTSSQSGCPVKNLHSYSENVNDSSDTELSEQSSTSESHTDQVGYSEPKTNNDTNGSASVLVETQEQIVTSGGNVSSSIFSKTVAGKKMYMLHDIILNMRTTLKSSKFCKSGEDLIRSLVEGFSEADEKLLRKAVTWWLMFNCEKKYYPSREEYIIMAESISHFFPKMKSSNEACPWDVLFDPQSEVSPLDCYARNKRSRDGMVEMLETVDADLMFLRKTDNLEYLPKFNQD